MSLQNHPIAWQAFEIDQETGKQLNLFKEQMKKAGFEKTHVSTVQGTKVVEYRRGQHEVRLQHWHGNPPWGNFRMIIAITATRNGEKQFGKHERLFYVDEFENLYKKFKERSARIQEVISRLN